MKIILTFTNDIEMAFSSAMGFKIKTLHYKNILLVLGCLFLLEVVQKAFCTKYTINTSNSPTISNSSSVLINGIIQSKTFTGPNGESWDHEVAVFEIPDSKKHIFGDGNTVEVTGNNSLSLNTTGDLTINTALDVSGQEVKDEETSLFLRGGFVRRSNSCCVLGAGPGAAFSYHGGGHGGRGGGYYQDHNTSRYYSWDYHDVNYLLGGSTSTVLFESKAGSGGGAIEIIATNGILTINANIKADGYNSKNTSEEHCAGGSSGGLIRLKGESVVLTDRGNLSARGGNSGFNNSTLKHCGDGGGGGVIQVFSTFDNNTEKQLHVKGGRGIDRGEPGVVFLGVFFNDGPLNINTSDCSMKWLSILVHKGVLEHHKYRTPDNLMRLSYTVCSFTFKSSLHIGRGAQVSIFGKNALKIVSERGNIELMTTFDLSGTNGKPGPRSLGAFVMKNLNERNVGPGNVTKCNAIDLFANDFETLLGGSVCIGNSISDTAVSAVGGGAFELVAKEGTIVIGKEIKVDGYSNNDKAGATGGLIRLIGKKVHLKDTASFSAKSSSTGSNLASGGIIQIKSDMDIEGLCETKFHVTGVRDGLVNVMVSALESYQVQFIQDGTLLINTTLCIWVHRTHNNYSMAYSQFGSITNVTTNDMKFSICSFNFKPPIIVNGSANVTLTGEHALSIDSDQGIYIGVDFVIDSGMVAAKSKYLGGFCVKEPSLAAKGNGPGRGQPDTNAGGGHGGRGGLFFEDKSGKKYGYTYGYDPFLLIGGSTGTSNQTITGIRGCGGGAIRISSKKNLTINAAIQANGYSATFFNGLHPYGGSSGGTIYLGAQQVILGDRAMLEAKGSDGAGPGNQSTGGGGGGVIIINSTNPFLGDRPDPAVNTRGGQGLVPGESGVLIIKDSVYHEPRDPVVEILSNFSGCYHINGANLPPRVKMFAHEARPKTCLSACIANSTLFAVIRNELCYCMNKNTSFGVRNTSMCKQPCPATFNYSCGGEADDIYSVYTTGVILPVTLAPPPPTTEPIPSTMFAPTTRPFDKASSAFTELNQKNITKDNVQEVVQELANLTQTTELNGGDTLAAVSIINKLASGNVLSPKNKNETQQTGKAIVETASRILGTGNEASWKFLGTKNKTTEKTSSYNVLEAIEKIAVDLGSGLEEEENVTIETDHVALGIIKKNMANFTGDSYPHYDQLGEKWQFEDKLFIPAETANAFKKRGASETTVFFVLYNRINSALKSNLEEGTVINSRVISVGFDQDLMNPLPKPVIISFSTYQMENYTGPVCSFLDFSNKTSGNWSNSGVKMTSSEGNKIVCESNHLTNFAILMQVKEIKNSKAHTQALQMITYIGCGISLFGLALTLATFLSLETLASERTSIHKNLVVAIGLAQIIFLAGIDVVYNPIACKMVALCLHYLFMAAFTWMCCEGLHLYTKVIEVFSSEASKMKYYYMLGWGVPLIIVIISAASRIDGYSTETACWISIDHGLIWAFVGPVLVIMCINFVVMVMVIRVILASVTSIQNPGNTSQVKAGLKGMVVLLPLLGLTWVFGLMAVNEKTIAFQYIFAILNSLQGLFIFAFHCIGNSEVRVAYKRLHEKRTLAKSLPEHSLSSGNHHKNVEEFKRRMNSRETNSTGDEDIVVTKAIRSVSDVKLTSGTDHVAMQTFGDADSGRWSLNCPSPDPPCIVYQSATKNTRGNSHSAPDIPNGPKATPRESYRSDGNYPTDRYRYRAGNQGNTCEETTSTNKYQRF